jgi:hypothetical protein
MFFPTDPAASGFVKKLTGIVHEPPEQWRPVATFLDVPLERTPLCLVHSHALTLAQFGANEQTYFQKIFGRAYQLRIGSVSPPYQERISKKGSPYTIAPFVQADIATSQNESIRIRFERAFSIHRVNGQRLGP